MKVEKDDASCVTGYSTLMSARTTPDALPPIRAYASSPHSPFSSLIAWLFACLAWL